MTARRNLDTNPPVRNVSSITDDHVLSELAGFRSCLSGGVDETWLTPPHDNSFDAAVNAGLIPGQRGGVKPGQWVWDGDMQRVPIGALCMSP